MPSSVVRTFSLISVAYLGVACTSGGLPEPNSPRPNGTNTPSAGALGGKADPLSAGKEFTCAIAGDGRVKCWGRNDAGQLGTGTTSPMIARPTFVADVNGAMAVAAGGTHACVLLKSGDVSCWGHDDSIVGNDTVIRQRATPLKDAKDVRTVTAGSRHDCILSNSGKVQCIGWGSDGQIGNGAQQPAPALTDVVGLKGVTAVAAGQLHTCALLENGNAMCWGSGRYGRLGNAATNQYTFAMAPVDVVGMRDKVAQVAPGGDRTCALTARGGVKCWGQIRPGRVLTEQVVSDYAATPLEVNGLSSGVRAITVGGNHACALLEGGGVKCWGWNENGQLGNGTTTDTEEPVSVTGFASEAVAVRAGDRHTCALLSSGKIMCWGANGFGQLGNGAKEDSGRPVEVVDFP